MAEMRKGESMIRIAVIDDDAACRTQVKETIQAYAESCQRSIEVETCGKAKELLWKLEDKRYFDIFILDVELPDMNGLMLAQKIRMYQFRPRLIFISSHIEYSPAGYEQQAYRYIMKDEISEKLPPALDFLVKEMEEVKKRYYIIETYSTLKKLDHDDIYYLQKEGKYIWFYTAGGEEKERCSLSSAFNRLQSEDFLYIDKGIIVNIKHVLQISGGKIIMRDKKEFPVSAGQFQKVKKAVSVYWHSRM